MKYLLSLKIDRGVIELERGIAAEHVMDMRRVSRANIKLSGCELTYNQRKVKKKA